MGVYIVGPFTVLQYVRESAGMVSLTRLKPDYDRSPPRLVCHYTTPFHVAIKVSRLSECSTDMILAYLYLSRFEVELLSYGTCSNIQL